MVTVTNLTKRYGDHTALSGVSFTLKEGKIYGLLGPNGAGKSTTMNIMTGYIGASEGTVVIDDLDIYKDAKKAKALIGYLPEIPPLYPDMSVHEYLMFVAELRHIEKDKRLLKVEEIMDETEITDVADRLIKNLSKGYRQRVGFAQAIIGDPKLIILDEPTVGLDPKQILEFRELLRKYGKNHIVLISSHILSEIKEVCEHVFIISHGKLVADVDMASIGDSLEEKFFELTDAEPEEEPVAEEEEEAEEAEEAVAAEADAEAAAVEETAEETVAVEEEVAAEEIVKTEDAPDEMDSMNDESTETANAVKKGDDTDDSNM